MDLTTEEIFNFIEIRNIDSLKEAIELGFPVDSLSQVSQSNALHVSIEEDYPEIVDYLIGVGADIEKIVHGLTPLQHAVDIKCLMMRDDEEQEGKFDVIKILLSNGASIYSRGGIDKSALEIAEQYQYDSLVNLLKFNYVDKDRD